MFGSAEHASGLTSSSRGRSNIHGMCADSHIYTRSVDPPRSITRSPQPQLVDFLNLTMSNTSPDKYKWLPLWPLPRTQALNTKTFRPPPLDGSLTVPEMYDWHLENSPEHPLFVHSAEDGMTGTIKMAEAVKAMHRAGRKIQSLFEYDPKSRPEVPYLAFVANSGVSKALHRFHSHLTDPSDTITFFTTMVGVMRIGLAAFPISTRNSPAAIAHLLTKTRAPYLLVGPEPAYQELVAHALKLLEETKTPIPRIASMPVFEDLYAPQPHVPFEPLPALSFSMDDPVLIMHSSGQFTRYTLSPRLTEAPGSTSFPKPVPWTNYRFIMLGIAPCERRVDRVSSSRSLMCFCRLWRAGLVRMPYNLPRHADVPRHGKSEYHRRCSCFVDFHTRWS